MVNEPIIIELRNYNAQINVYLEDELFIEDESHILVEGTDKAKWKTIIDDYMKEYERFTSKTNPFFG